MDNNGLEKAWVAQEDMEVIFEDDLEETTGSDDKEVPVEEAVSEIQEIRNILGQIINEVNAEFGKYKETIDLHTQDLSGMKMSLLRSKSDLDNVKGDLRAIRQDLGVMSESLKTAVVNQAISDWNHNRAWLVRKLSNLQNKVRESLRNMLLWMAERV